ncbi:MAG: hypothetical protein ACHQ4H_16610 [Ktedonobacterales bacterium]
MGDSQQGKRKGLFGRIGGDKTGRTIEKATIIGLLAAAGAELLRSSGRMRGYTDVQIENIAKGLSGQLTMLTNESARLDRSLKNREAREPMPLAMALATLEAFAMQLEAGLERYGMLLAQTNPALRAVVVNAAQSGVHALPAPDTEPAGVVVDADPSTGPQPAGGTEPTTPPAGVSAPSLSHLSGKQRGALANDLRAAFAEIIHGAQYVQATIGAAGATNALKIETAIAQARALVTGLRDHDRQIRQRYGVA